MGRLLDIVTPLHKATKRDYLARMMDDKVHCMMKAKEYEFDYWDGDRRFGYGGYKFIDGRWKPVAQALIDIYGLKDGAKILDVGCGKALPALRDQAAAAGLRGHRLRHLEARARRRARGDQAASVPLPRAGSPIRGATSTSIWSSRSARCTTCACSSCETAVQEIERVGKNKYIMVESYRNELEQFNLQCWALTAESLLRHRRNGSGSTATSAIPATTNSSTSNNADPPDADQDSQGGDPGASRASR